LVDSGWDLRLGDFKVPYPLDRYTRSSDSPFSGSSLHFDTGRAHRGQTSRNTFSPCTPQNTCTWKIENKRDGLQSTHSQFQKKQKEEIQGRKTRILPSPLLSSRYKSKPLINVFVVFVCLCVVGLQKGMTEQKEGREE